MASKRNKAFFAVTPTLNALVTGKKSGIGLSLPKIIEMEKGKETQLRTGSQGGRRWHDVYIVQFIDTYHGRGWPCQ